MLYLQVTDRTQVGTIAFVVDEEALLVRVTRGWQYISVSEHNIINAIRSGTYPGPL